MPFLPWGNPDELRPELKFKEEILGRLDKNNLLLINTPWYWLHQDLLETEAKNWLKESDNNKIVSESLYDPYPCEVSSEIDETRHIRITTEDIPFWLLYVDKFFKHKPVNELEFKSGKNIFLCYQRKPDKPRAELYSRLKKYNGVITYGGDMYENVPNDISTLGDLDIWNNSLLNIVSETVYDPSYKVFVSEKAFKPIVGHRPFLIYGDKRINTYLKKLGFKTFEKYFNYTARNYGGQAYQLEQIVKSIDNPQLVYADLYDDINYNYHHFKSIVKEVYRNIEKLKEVL